MKFNDFKNSENLLSNEQMKSVKGGTGTCGYSVTMYDEVSNQSWTEVVCGVRKSEALGAVMAYGGNWCCDSCGTSSYCAK
jgi:natural product precursor